MTAQIFFLLEKVNGNKKLRMYEINTSLWYAFAMIRFMHVLDAFKNTNFKRFKVKTQTIINQNDGICTRRNEKKKISQRSTRVRNKHVVLLCIRHDMIHTCTRCVLERCIGVGGAIEYR